MAQSRVAQLLVAVRTCDAYTGAEPPRDHGRNSFLSRASGSVLTTSRGSSQPRRA
jgi:hypothetical protein